MHYFMQFFIWLMNEAHMGSFSENNLIFKFTSCTIFNDGNKEKTTWVIIFDHDNLHFPYP
jgi:hypothetical protein